MKQRLGFVSNSSSSSYVCDICGEGYVGYDGVPGELIVCENDHYMCEKHINEFEVTEDIFLNWLKREAKKEKFRTKTEDEYFLTAQDELNQIKDKKITWQELMEEMSDNGKIAEFNCPICQMKEISIFDLIKLNKKLGFKYDFVTYDDLREYLDGD